MPKNFLKSLIAVVSGNAVYFLLMPHLPRRAQHGIYRIFDLGLLVDFWICLVIYGIIELLQRWRRRRSQSGSD